MRKTKIAVSAKKLNAQSEHRIQAAFVEWCRANEGKYAALALAFAIPNGGARSAATGALLKAEGVRRGVPDWCLPVPIGDYAGLWIEFKTQKGAVSPEQRDYMAALENAGHVCIVCRSWIEAAEVVEWYFFGREDKAKEV